MGGADAAILQPPAQNEPPAASSSSTTPVEFARVPSDIIPREPPRQFSLSAVSTWDRSLNAAAGSVPRVTADQVLAGWKTALHASVRSTQRVLEDQCRLRDNLEDFCAYVRQVEDDAQRARDDARAGEKRAAEIGVLLAGAREEAREAQAAVRRLEERLTTVEANAKAASSAQESRFNDLLERLQRELRRTQTTLAS